MAIAVACATCGQAFRAKDGARGSLVKCPGCSLELTIAGEHLPDRDVFVSHSHKDKARADAIVAALEAQGMRCWVAPRDISGGMTWGAAIIGGIEQSWTMLLILSKGSNSSRQVLREVERAVAKDVAILPVRIEEFVLSRDLEYFLSACHWFDATQLPFESRLDELVRQTRMLVDPATPAPRMEPLPRAEGKRHRSWAGLWLALFLLIAGITAGLPRLLATTPPPAISTPAELAACKAAAEAGDGQAMIRLITAYSSAAKPIVDQQQAIAWFHKAQQARLIAPQPSETEFHIQRISFSAGYLDENALAALFPDDLHSSSRRHPDTWWNADGQWRYVDRRQFSPPLGFGAAIACALVEPVLAPGETVSPLHCSLEHLDALQLTARIAGHERSPPPRIAYADVLVVSRRNAAVAWLQWVGLALALGFLLLAARSFYRRPQPPFAWAMSPWFWTMAIAVVFALLVILKTMEWMLERGLPAEDVLGEALAVRFKNASSCLLVTHLIAAVLFAAALKRRIEARPLLGDVKVEKKWIALAAAFVLFYVGLYVHAIYRAPDPGTFMTYKTSWLYGVQFCEGYANILVATVAALWIATAFYVASLMAGDRRIAPSSRRAIWILLSAGAIFPIVVFTITILLDWRKTHWLPGNLAGALMSYAVAIAFEYVLLAFFVAGKMLAR